MNTAVTVTNLAKRYRRNPIPAVDDLSFSVASGEIFGLLGPNGAGKTTTIGVLTTRVLPTAGSATIHGVDVVKAPSSARQLLAVVPQRNNLDRSLNIRQNLLFHAIYHGVGRAERVKRADEILAQMGLTDQAKKRIDFVSGGQAQRVMIARALMHKPKVLFLDEPSTGLDPQSRLFVHERIVDLRNDGVTVVITTHDMDEAAKLCDRVGIVDHGKLLALDTPSALTRALPGSTTVSVTVSRAGHSVEEVEKLLSTVDGIQRVERILAAPNGMPAAALAMTSGISMGPPPGPPATSDTDMAQFRLYTELEPMAVSGAALAATSALGCTISELSIGIPSLEDVFIQLTGRELR